MEKKRRALITGGSRGIGKAISIMLARNGYDILINYRNNITAANETKAIVESYHVNCKLLEFDIANFSNAKKIIETEIEQNGIIDVLVFNAGIRKDALFPLMSEDEWESVININLKSFYYIVRPVVKGMFQQKFGKIVVMSSTSGLTGMAGQVNYSSTKFGLIGAAKSLAVEVARANVNVNIVAPGFIETDMTQEMTERSRELIKTIPARRIGNTEDVANTVEFLISEKAKYIIGQVIAVNGGVFT